MTYVGEPALDTSGRGFFDRYHAVGLTHNPFAIAAHNGELAADLFVDRGLADPPPPGSHTLVQVIGDPGAGKTTQVQHWRRATPGPYHYIPQSPYRDRWIRPPMGPIVYGDELDRMPRPLRHQWFRDLAALGSTIVAGTHVDLTKPALRSGFTVVTHHVPPADRAALTAIIDARLEAAALTPAGPMFSFSTDEVSAIHAASGGVVRRAEVLCHEVIAERVL